MRHASLWAIAPKAITAVMQILTGTAPQAAHPGPKSSFPGRASSKIAVIPVHGLLTQDGPYGSTYADIADAVEKSAADPDVKHIVLSVDSPGGQVTGLPEAAAVIAAAARVKPVHAIIEGTAASAAYWLASQATHISLTPSGEVGSVGVRMMHADMSKSLDNAGIKVTELHSGDFKTEWSPYKPLSEDAQADMQTRLDATHADFIGAVASGRGRRASASITRQRFGEGRMFSGPDALRHGLVDNLQSPRDFYRTITQAAPSAPPSKARTASATIAPVAGLPIVSGELQGRRAALELERARVAP